MRLGVSIGKGSVYGRHVWELELTASMLALGIVSKMIEREKVVVSQTVRSLGDHDLSRGFVESIYLHPCLMTH